MRFVEGINHATFAVRDLERSIHASDLTTRLDAERRNPPPGMRFYR